MENPLIYKVWAIRFLWLWVLVHFIMINYWCIIVSSNLTESIDSYSCQKTSSALHLLCSLPTNGKLTWLCFKYWIIFYIYFLILFYKWFESLLKMSSEGHLSKFLYEWAQFHNLALWLLYIVLGFFIKWQQQSSCYECFVPMTCVQYQDGHGNA